MINNRKSVYLWIAICIALTLSNIFTHLTNDFFVFWAWAKQVAMSNNSGIAALSGVWEIKGLLSRAFYYELYSLTSLQFSEFTTEAQQFYKFVAYLQLYAILFVAVTLIPKDIVPTKLNRLKVFLIIASSIALTHFSSHLQPEFISLFLLVLSTALVLRKSALSSLLGGIVLGLTFFLKSPIPLMGGSVFFAYLLIRKTTFIETLKHFSLYGVSMILTILSILCYLQITCPQELIDITDAGYYQQVLLHQPLKTIVLSIYYCFEGLFVCNWQILTLLWGILFTVIFFRNNAKHWNELFKIVGLWFFPLAYICLSNCFFIYHYSLCLYPTVIILLICNKSLSLKFYQNKLFYAIIIGTLMLGGVLGVLDLSILNSRMLWIGISIIIIVLLIFKRIQRYAIITACIISIFVFTTTLSAFSRIVSGANKDYNRNLEKQICVMNNDVNGIDDEPVLYLDSGCGAFVVKSKTALRYFYPLPIQRIDEEHSPFTKSQTFNIVKESILDYQGKYLTLDSAWFYRYNHPEIKDYITKNWILYKEIPYGTFSWDIYPEKTFREGSIKLYKHI